MKINNLTNYPGAEANGVFSNSATPTRTKDGDTLFLVSNYAGLYGIVLGDEHGGILVFVTDSWSFANSQRTAMSVEEG